jgi:predicted permease
MNSVLNRVTGQYFETVGIAIAKGRAISDSDAPNGPKVAVINEGLAKHLFPKGDAIGHMLTIGIDSVKGPWQIVGIARDTKLFGPRNEKTLQLTYIPIAQIEAFEPVEAAKPGEPVKPPVENQNRYAHMMLVRTTGDPAKVTGELRAAFAAVDPNLPLTNITTISEQVSQFMSHEELISSLTAMFALLALVLAGIGLYGVMSYNVVRRTNEIGIRLALGAPSPQVLWMVLKESLLLLAVGVVLGVPLTLAATRVVKDQLFGLSAFDPATIGAAIVVVSGMTLLAAWLPARRASRVDPMVALRCD